MLILCGNSMRIGMCVSIVYTLFSVRCAKVKCQRDDDNDVNKRANKNRNHRVKTVDKIYMLIEIDIIQIGKMAEKKSREGGNANEMGRTTVQKVNRVK